MAVRQLIAGFSDIIVTARPLQKSEENQMAAVGVTPMTIPAALGGVAVIYNFPGFNAPLNFSAATLAKIFSGSVQNWNSILILDENPALKNFLQNSSQTIIPVVRAEAVAGVNLYMSDFLDTYAPESWSFGINLSKYTCQTDK